MGPDFESYEEFFSHVRKHNLEFVYEKSTTSGWCSTPIEEVYQHFKARIEDEQEKLQYRDAKPCPFCGGKAALHIGENAGPPNSYTIQCETHKCPGGYYHQDTEARAVTLWNRRI